jgi:hypothetical protein
VAGVAHIATERKAMSKSKHIGKLYKTDHNSVTEYWPYWAREIVENIVTNYFANRDDDSDDPMDLFEGFEPRNVLETIFVDGDVGVPGSAMRDVVPEVIAELQNVITFLQAVVKENE